MRVIAIDGGDAKGELCKKLGAEHYIDFHKVKDVAAEVKSITTYGAHGVVVTAFTKDAYDTAPGLLRPGGTLVAVGIPHTGSVIVGAQPMIVCMNQLKVVGSLVGTLQEVEECLDLTGERLGSCESISKYR